jgi:hypothetical protein
MDDYDSWKRWLYILGKEGKEHECEALRHLVNRMIGTLYDVTDEGFRVRSDLPFDDSKEPINWGDLSCVEVEWVEGDEGFLVRIEEASPDCPNLCNWILTTLRQWGWPVVEVVTEW